MDFLVLSPPVCTPSEPPSGAFLLTAGLAGRGFNVGLLDLSLEFFHRVFHAPGIGHRRVDAALKVLLNDKDGYSAQRHRSAAGALHRALQEFGAQHPGWNLTLMDIAPPEHAWDPESLAAHLEAGSSPFEALWHEVVAPAVALHRPQHVLISLAYLSQLPAAIDLHRFLMELGVSPIVGGSLPSSLAATGQGLEALGAVFPRIELGDGRSLFGETATKHLLDRLVWPSLLSDKPYFSSRPVAPLALSTGCFWNRCLFCPDREMPFIPVPESAIASFLESMPGSVRAKRPVVHLLDSALPPAQLRRFLPHAREAGIAFYGFARPTERLLRGNLLRDAADSGCLMLQLGAEGGSRSLLDRYDKGLDPIEMVRVLRATAEAGIRTYLYLLFGLPGETEEDRLATLELVAANADAVDFLNLSLFNLPRLSELTERAAEFGIELSDFPLDGRLQLYRPFTVGGEPPRVAARRFLASRFKRDPRIRPALLRTPRWLRAAHMALMKVEGRRD